MDMGGQKGLALILAREFASNVAVPVFLVDPTNTLVFYNEAAEAAFGGPFGNTGELRSGDWASKFSPTHPDGSPVDRHKMPVVVALEQRTPSHAVHEVTDTDGTRRTVEVTAIPLFSRKQDFVGVMATFWEAAPAAGSAG